MSTGAYLLIFNRISVVWNVYSVFKNEFEVKKKRNDEKMTVKKEFNT